MRLRQLIAEGGNIFKDKDGQITTRDIDKVDVAPTLNWLEKLTRLPIRGNTIGSVGKKPTSGDIDIAVDAELVGKDDLMAKLSQWVGKQPGQPKDWLRKSGISVHLKTPIAGDPARGYVQTDFMFYRDMEFAKWMAHYDPNTSFKNADKIILMNSIAKSHGFKLGVEDGLTVRDSGKFVTKDPAEIARMLLGPDATPTDLESVERIMAAVKSDPEWEKRTADARDNFASRGLDLDSAVR